MFVNIIYKGNTMKNLIVQTEDGLWWPRIDGGDAGPGSHNSTSCWYGLHMGEAHDVPVRISQYVPEKGVVIQAGGNCGFYIKQYAAIFKTVYTFEPDPVNFYCLNLNVPDANVYRFQACLGSKHETVSTGKFLNDVGSTHVTGTGLTPTFMIDDLALTRCDLIQLDVEGYELNALRGAQQTIQTLKPVLALECFDGWAQRYDSNLRKIELFLGSFGYVCVANISSSVSTDKIYKFQE